MGNYATVVRPRPLRRRRTALRMPRLRQTAL